MQPQIVLWVYYEGNELSELLHRNDEFLYAYLNKDYSQQLLDRQAEIDRTLKATFTQMRHHSQGPRRESGFVGRLERVLGLEALRIRLGLVGLSTPNPKIDESLDLFKAILREAIEVTNEWDGRLILVCLPQYERYLYPWVVSSGRERIISSARGLGLQVIDLQETFATQGDPIKLFPFRRPGHYNTQGHRLVAETILSHLTDRTIHSR